MPAEQNGHRAGRWVVAVTAATLIAGGAFGGLAYAGGSPAGTGEPGEDGEDVSCVAHETPENEPVCNVVGEDGADGEPGSTG